MRVGKSINPWWGMGGGVRTKGKKFSLGSWAQTLERKPEKERNGKPGGGESFILLEVDPPENPEVLGNSRKEKKRTQP